MTDILDKLADLLRQATTERTHYYVGSCVREAMAEIKKLRSTNTNNQSADTRELVAWLDEHARSLVSHYASTAAVNKPVVSVVADQEYVSRELKTMHAIRTMLLAYGGAAILLEVVQDYVKLRDEREANEKLWGEPGWLKEHSKKWSRLYQKAKVAINAAALNKLGGPVECIIHCPTCHKQHIDDGEWATRPHKEHLCDNCGELFRVADTPTVGVAILGSAEKRAMEG